MGTPSRFHVVVAVTGVAFGMTFPYVPLLAGQLGAAAGLAGLITAANAPAVLAVDVFGTGILPHLGGRAVLVAGLVSFGLGSALAACPFGLGLLLVSRLLEGIGLALFMSGALYLVVRTTDAAGRARALGRFNAHWFLGIAVGPLLGGLIAQTSTGATGYRRAFAACAVVSFTAALLTRVAIDPYPSSGALTFTLPDLRGLRDPRLSGAVLLGGFGEAVRDSLAGILLPLAAVSAGLTNAAIGIVLTALAVADVISMQLSGVLADRYGRSRPLIVTLVVAAGFSFYAATADSTEDLLVIAVALGLTLGSAWIIPPVMVVDLAGGDSDDGDLHTRRAVAAYRICADIGLFVGLFGGGLVVGWVGALPAFAVFGGFLLAGALLTAAIGDTRRTALAPASVPAEL
ncbi:MAG: transporter, family, inner rane transport protein [Frankiales bacterium]|nr:transporter, family, inner rane transport protein [Frankiales bacterium]